MARTGVAIAALVIAVAVAWPFTAELVAVDRCLDAGGSFDYKTGQCDFKVSHASIGIWERHGVALLVAFALGAVSCGLLLRRKPHEQPRAL